MSDAESVLRFWFAPAPGSEAGPFRAHWFIPDRQFDGLCTERFLASHEDAANGCLEDWRNDARSCLALVLLLDQFPRNMFRGTARAFKTDTKARETARHAIRSGFDRKLAPLMRMFLHLPFEHSENMDDQLESVRLARALVAENPKLAEALVQAEEHLATIDRFGRFPRRNRALGRHSTQQEINFLTAQKEK